MNFWMSEKTKSGDNLLACLRIVCGVSSVTSESQNSTYASFRSSFHSSCVLRRFIFPSGKFLGLERRHHHHVAEGAIAHVLPGIAACLFFRFVVLLISRLGPLMDLHFH